MYIYIEDMYVICEYNVYKTYPREPRAASGPKRQAPGRLQHLEKLIGLEKSGQIQGIEQPQDDNVSQRNGRETRLALERGRRGALVAGHGLCGWV